MGEILRSTERISSYYKRLFLQREQFNKMSTIAYIQLIQYRLSNRVSNHIRAGLLATEYRNEKLYAINQKRKQLGR